MYTSEVSNHSIRTQSAHFGPLAGFGTSFLSPRFRGYWEHFMRQGRKTTFRRLGERLSSPQPLKKKREIRDFLDKGGSL
jgi:hypothetical protein